MFVDTILLKNGHSLDYLAVSLFGTMIKSESWVGNMGLFFNASFFLF